MPEAAIGCEDLVVGYGEVPVLSGFSFAARRGEVTAVIGPNGAGKTTLLNALSGVLRHRSGHVTFEGAQIDGWRAYRRARAGIVHVPEGRGILTQLTVAENLQLGLDWRAKLAPPEAKALLDDQLERFPILRERFQMPAASLSGGEQQMLAIARALLMRPRVLLLDEPSLGLAPILVERVFEQLRRIKDQSQTVVLVEQNATLAMELADWVCLLERGEIVGTGTPEEMAGSARVREAFLPQARRGPARDGVSLSPEGGVA